MKAIFIDTIATEEGIYVFRFTKAEGENKYIITTVNQTGILPFAMRMGAPGEWRIESADVGKLRLLEKALSNIICAAGAPEVYPFTDDILTALTNYTEKHLKAGKDKPEVRIETLILDLNLDKETVLRALEALENKQLVTVQLNKISFTKGRKLIGTVSLTDKKQ
jgi:hypothetical protein